MLICSVHAFCLPPVPHTTTVKRSKQTMQSTSTILWQTSYALKSPFCCRSATQSTDRPIPKEELTTRSTLGRNAHGLDSFNPHYYIDTGDTFMVNPVATYFPRLFSILFMCTFIVMSNSWNRILCRSRVGHCTFRASLSPRRTAAQSRCRCVASRLPARISSSSSDVPWKPSSSALHLLKQTREPEKYTHRARGWCLVLLIHAPIHIFYSW